MGSLKDWIPELHGALLYIDGFELVDNAKLPNWPPNVC